MSQRYLSDIVSERPRNLFALLKQPKTPLSNKISDLDRMCEQNVFLSVDRFLLLRQNYAYQAFGRARKVWNECLSMFDLDPMSPIPTSSLQIARRARALTLHSRDRLTVFFFFFLIWGGRVVEGACTSPRRGGRGLI